MSRRMDVYKIIGLKSGFEMEPDITAAYRNV